MLTLTILAAGLCSGFADTVTLKSLLRETAQLDALARYPDPAYRSLQASSYNRASVARDKPGWFADSDGVGFIRQETINGRSEWVMMEHDGPGCITHFWTPFFYYGFGNRVGPNIRIYLDGSDTPVIDEGFIELLTRNDWSTADYGACPPKKNSFQVPSPFADFTARAGDLYLPIPFAKRCKVTMTSKPFYNIINYRAYPPGTLVKTFNMQDDRAVREDLSTTGAALLSPAAPDGGEKLGVGGVLSPGETRTLTLPEGNGVVRYLEVQLDPATVKADPSVLRSVVLTAEFDGGQTVWCPVGDFFCSANAINPMQTWTRTVTSDGKMVCRWVMPYQRTASVSLNNLGKREVRAKLTARTCAWSWDERSMHFHANWRSDDIIPGTPFLDWNFIDISGKGVLVGDVWTVLSPDRGWWGEGDEKIYVDGAYDHGFPTHFGTGTEDYYGWAGGRVPKRVDVFDHPFLANVSVGSTEEDNPRGFNVCTRIRSLDAIPFSSRLRFDMEASPGTQIRNPWNLLGYSAVVYWYGKPGATHNRPPLPDDAVKPIMSLARLDKQAEEIRRGNVRRVEGAIEFEGLKPSAKSQGLSCGPQRPAAAFKPDKTWSSGNHFFVAGRQAGDFVEFTFTEQFHPVNLLLHLTKSFDFGVVRLSVNGKPVGEDIDLYAPQPVTEDVQLGRAVPVDNRIVLRMELVGKSPKSRGAKTYMGLDCIVVKP